MLLNAPAVHDDVRHQGLGTRPLLWAQSRAQLLGLARLGLHVLADNMLARHFYRTHGVIERGVAEVPSHPRLRHSGGSILMSRAVCAEGAAKRSLMKCREKSEIGSIHVGVPSQHARQSLARMEGRGDVPVLQADRIDRLFEGAPPATENRQRFCDGSPRPSHGRDCAAAFDQSQRRRSNWTYLSAVSS